MLEILPSLANLYVFIMLIRQSNTKRKAGKRIGSLENTQSEFIYIHNSSVKMLGFKAGLIYNLLLPINLPHLL